MVGDDDVDLRRPLAGQLGEALAAVRALLGAQALGGGDADLPPGAVGDPRVELVAVAGRGLVRPLAQPHHVTAELRRGRRVEQPVLVVVGHPAEELVAAQVVGPALEDRVGRAAAEHRLDRVDERGQVPVDDLLLQRDGCRRDHDPLAVHHGRDQVRQRLAGAGAGLDQQVPALRHRRLDRLGHLHLAGALGSPESLDGGGQQHPDRGLRRGVVVGGPGHLWRLPTPRPPGPRPVHRQRVRRSGPRPLHRRRCGWPARPAGRRRPRPAAAGRRGSPGRRCSPSP